MSAFIDFHPTLFYTLPSYGCITAFSEVMELTLSDETLKAMIRDYGGFELTDEELGLIRPELEVYQNEAAKLRELDLSGVLSGRLLRVDEEG